MYDLRGAKWCPTTVQPTVNLPFWTGHFFSHIEMGLAQPPRLRTRPMSVLGADGDQTARLKCGGQKDWQ